MFFQTKKIKLETLPEYLKAVRQHLALSVKEVVDKTGISPKILAALEKGAYELLPSPVYVKGFLAKLAAIYHIDKQALIQQFGIEEKIQANLGKSIVKRPLARRKFWQELVVTPKFLSLLAGLVFVSGTLAYIFWQVFTINQPPMLEIDSPKDLTVIQQSIAEINGRTDPTATLTINSEPVFVDKAGRFRASLGISSGPKEFTLAAKNRFNKSTTKVLTLIGQSPTRPDPQNAVSLELNFFKTVEISYKIDGNQAMQAAFQAGDTKQLLAKRQILLSTSNAGAVKAKVNGENLGFLGRDGEKLSDISFSSGSGNMK